MKRIMAATLVASLVSLGMSGCSDAAKSSTKQETKISTPGGTTTITTERNVKTTGEKPPVVTP
jgi:ABC-type glycerol-3-phosphate transport system substrate-binding protein